MTYEELTQEIKKTTAQLHSTTNKTHAYELSTRLNDLIQERIEVQNLPCIPDRPNLRAEHHRNFKLLHSMREAGGIYQVSTYKCLGCNKVWAERSCLTVNMNDPIYTTIPAFPFDEVDTFLPDAVEPSWPEVLKLKYRRISRLGIPYDVDSNMPVAFTKALDALLDLEDERV